MKIGRFLLYTAAVFGAGIYVGHTNTATIGQAVRTAEKDLNNSQLKKDITDKFMDTHYNLCDQIDKDGTLRERFETFYDQACKYKKETASDPSSIANEK